MGVLVASAIGLIVITGITKIFVHTNTQLKKSEESANRINLTSLIANYMNSPEACKKTLSSQMATELKAGSEKNFSKILTKDGGTVIDLDAEKARLKAQYGISGYTVFQMKCQETSPNTCQKCSGTYPQSPACEKKWSLSLISQTEINGFPTFNSVFRIPIIIKHTGTADSDFECNSPGSNSPTSLKNVNCPPNQVLTGFDNNGQLVCVAGIDLTNSECPSGSVLKGFNTSGTKVCELMGNKPCATKTFPSADSSGSTASYPISLKRQPCKITAGNHGNTKTGVCSGTYNKSGTCRYKCNNGIWHKVINTCSAS